MEWKGSGSWIKRNDVVTKFGGELCHKKLWNVFFIGRKLWNVKESKKEVKKVVSDPKSKAGLYKKLETREGKRYFQAQRKKKAGSEIMSDVTKNDNQ